MKRCILAVIFACCSAVYLGYAQDSLKGSQQTSEKQKTTEEQSQEKEGFTVTANQTQLAMSAPDYMVTAGDIYSLSFAVGSSAVSYQIPIDTSYRVRVANLAVIDARGKTYLALKRQIEDIVTKNYPMSGVQFVLMSPAVFNVTIRGEVKNTMEQSAWALSRLSSAMSKNLTDYSSIRDVTVTSADGRSATYDLFKAIRTGDMSEDPYLRPGDIITVNRAERIVTLAGEVERPGIYQLLQDENLKDLVEVYGSGLTVRADAENIVVTRQENTTQKTGRVIYLDSHNIEQNYTLEPNDTVTVMSVDDLRPCIFIEGAILLDETESVTLEGSTRKAIQFVHGTDYAAFVRQNKSFFTPTSDLESAYIIRGKNIISLNINNLLYNDDTHSDVLLEPNDVLRIPFKQFFVSVAGSVNKPGRYPYIPDRTYDYYIGLAGGFVKSQNTNGKVTIVDTNGKVMDKNIEILPECTITAETNSFLYYFNQYAPVITTIFSLISTTISVIIAVQ